MSWEAFLRKIADDFKLSNGEREVFYLRFGQDNKGKTDREVRELFSGETDRAQSYAAFKKEIFKKFSPSKHRPEGCEGLKGQNSHKAERLLEWLETKFLEYQPPDRALDDKDSVTEHVLDWKQIGQNVLEAQQKQWLSSHPLGSANRRVKDVYVPLGLVERKQEQPRHKARDIAPNDFSVPKQEQIETLKPVSHDEFFDGVLQGNSPKSAGQRIVVVGEPGAGKTTLLQKIAARVDGLAIWVDLASLKKDDTLENYLLKWVERGQHIIGQHSPDLVADPSQLSPAVRRQFTMLFSEQPVWLLLDGADEMASELGQPLGWIAQQLRDGGWWTQARVVLTCRLNVWSVGGDRLSPTFDVYRNLDFEPEDVTDFIGKWFQDEPETIKNLQAEIDQASDRMKSLIRNPLRLTLLCRTWTGLGDKLPETKAGLYQRLVDAHYEWNSLKEEFVIGRSLRKKLDNKLGELAKRAIDRPESRFRLRASFILEDEEWGYPNDKGSLFWWAIKLGWLNQIGLPDTGEKNADEAIYTFFHPTFQEYFAASVISTPEYFIKYDSCLPNFQKDIYRVFESEWLEVISLWIGRENISQDKKDLFIKRVLDFNDASNSNFYNYRKCIELSYFILENLKSRLTNDVIAELIRYSFPFYDKTLKKWRENLLTIEERAQYSLSRFPEEFQSQWIKRKFIEILNSSGSENFSDLKRSNFSSIIYYLARYNLRFLGSHFLQLSEDLIFSIGFLNLSDNQLSLLSFIFTHLPEISLVNETLTDFILNSLKYFSELDEEIFLFTSQEGITYGSQWLKKQVQILSDPLVQALNQVQILDVNDINKLESIASKFQDKQILINLSDHIARLSFNKKYNPGLNTSLMTLSSLIWLSSSRDWIIYSAFSEMVKIISYQPEKFDWLYWTFHKCNEGKIEFITEFISALSNMETCTNKTIELLLEIYDSIHEFEVHRQVCEALAILVDKHDKERDEIKIFLLDKALHHQDIYVQRQASFGLLRLDDKNIDVINTLERVSKNEEDDFLKICALENLIKLGNEEKKSEYISELEFLVKYSHASLSWSAIEGLLECDPKNLVVLDKLIETIVEDSISVLDDYSGEARRLLLKSSNEQYIISRLEQLLLEASQIDNRDYFLRQMSILQLLGKVDCQNHMANSRIGYILENANSNDVLSEAAKLSLELNFNHDKAFKIIYEMLLLLIDNSENESPDTLQSSALILPSPRFDSSLKKCVQKTLNRKIILGDVKATDIFIKYLMMNPSQGGIYRILDHKFSFEIDVDLTPEKNYFTTALQSVVAQARKYVDEISYDFESLRGNDLWQMLWFCSQNMSYESFYQSWQNNTLCQINYIDVANNYINESYLMNGGNTKISLSDINIELHATSSIYLLCLSFQISDSQTENAIAKRLWNRICRQAFPNKKGKPPDIEDLGDLEQELLSLQDELQVQKLAIIFHNCGPHPNLVSLLNQLTDFLHIGWITDQPVPFRSFHPDPIDTLASRIQSWLDEL